MLYNEGFFTPFFQWYTLNDVKSGRVHLIVEWVPTVSNSVRLDEVTLYIMILIPDICMYKCEYTYICVYILYIYITAFFLMCSVSQVLQLQSLQTFQNKTVPHAALLFVHIQGAHSLPVGRLQFIIALCVKILPSMTKLHSIFFCPIS